jgi:undecaprenyl pyrophosphate phosphatase UppP
MVLSDKLDAFRRKIFKYRLKQQYRKPFRIILLSILGLICTLIIGSLVSDGINALRNSKSYGKIKVDWYRDYNNVHLLEG